MDNSGPVFSSDLEAFRWSCFDTSFHAVHDGLNFDALYRLRGEDLAIAEKILLDAIPVTEDWRPIQAAGLLRLSKAAPILRVRRTTWQETPNLRPWFSWGLWQVAQDQNAASELTAIMMDHASPQNDRYIAANLLRDLPPSAPVVRALAHLAREEDGMLGYQALDTLKTYFKKDVEVIELIGECLTIRPGQVRRIANAAKLERLEALVTAKL